MGNYICLLFRRLRHVVSTSVGWRQEKKKPATAHPPTPVCLGMTHPSAPPPHRPFSRTHPKETTNRSGAVFKVLARDSCCHWAISHCYGLLLPS